MINLPRELIYQDCKNLKDFVNANELYKALYDYLDDELSRMKDPSLGRRMADGRFRDEFILSAFNDAFYFCILVFNDANAVNLWENYSSVYSRQTILVILSLLRNKNDSVDKMLDRFSPRLRPCYKDIVNDFKAKGQTFYMKLTPRLPDLNSPDNDWGKLTKGFDKEMIWEILGLWKDNKDKCKVCNKIWDAYRCSATYGLLFVELDDNFFKELIEMYFDSEPSPVLPVTTSSSENYDWVRQVVDYAKNRYDWSEAKPFSDMLNYLLRGKGNQALFDMVDEIELHFHQEKKRSDVNIDQAGNVFVNPQNVNNHG